MASKRLPLAKLQLLAGAITGDNARFLDGSGTNVVSSKSSVTAIYLQQLKSNNRDYRGPIFLHFEMLDDLC